LHRKASARVGQAAGEQQAQVLLLREDRDRRSSAPGAMTTSVKIFGDLFGGGAVERRLTAR
jgi:hypothetical protein